MAEFGILCHITSVYNKFGLGDFGKSAYDFVDFLKKIGATVWEVLPLNLANDFNCPYGAMSLHSFDEMFVDLEELCEFGLLEKWKLEALSKYKNSAKVKYDKIKPQKLALFECAFDHLKNRDFLDEFVKMNKHMWQYCYWRTLLEVFGVKDWHLVDRKYWDFEGGKAKKFVKETKNTFQKYAFFQYVLTRQWENLKEYANKNGIKIFGDVPAYCDRASVDVFAGPQYVKLDENFLPSSTGGSPADKMSSSLQNWGTCVYDWEMLEKDNFNYMIDRIACLMKKYDILRLDHFPAYVEHFEIPNGDESKARFVKGGGEKFFEKLAKKVEMKKLVVEDIGLFGNDCVEVKNKFNLCGMNVLQYAFDSDEKNLHLPSNVKNNTIYYTETHDSNTFMGFLKSLNKEELKKVARLLQAKTLKLKEIQICAIRNVLDSKAKIAIIPIQDLMFLDEKFRMNIAGVAANCWKFRLQKNFEKIVVKNTKRYFRS